MGESPDMSQSSDASPAARAAVYFLATPIHDNRVHYAYMSGVVLLSMAAPGQVIVGRYTSSYVPASRDALTDRFLKSDATHMLCIDPDIGWGPTDVEKLALANKDFATGIYASKQADRTPAVALLNRREGHLIEALEAPAGFMLLTRHCVERLVAAHPELVFDTPTGRVCSIWSPLFAGKPYSEDASFCARWRALGGEIWAHTQVQVKRYGDTLLTPASAPERRGA